jgi:hypothetical protein
MRVALGVGAFIMAACGLLACKSTASTVDAAPSSAPSASAAIDAGDPFADDEEFGDAPDAGCPISVHPGYCRNRCKHFASRQSSKHAARVAEPARYALGTCDTYSVFAERDFKDGGITEYYDTTGQLVAARDDRQRGCQDFGVVPTCTPVLAWKPEASVKFGTPTMSTSDYPPEVVARILRQRFVELRNCHATAQERDPGVHGLLALTIVIPKDGATTITKAKETTVSDAGLLTCALGVLAKATFPAPDTKVTTATVSLTFGGP